MSDDTSDDSDGFDDDDDIDDSQSHDELASQLASAGPTGVAAAAAISSTKSAFMFLAICNIIARKSFFITSLVKEESFVAR